MHSEESERVGSGEKKILLLSEHVYQSGNISISRSLVVPIDGDHSETAEQAGGERERGEKVTSHVGDSSESVVSK